MGLSEAGSPVDAQACSAAFTGATLNEPDVLLLPAWSPYDEYFQRRNERETRYYYNPRRDERTLKLRRIYFIKRS